MSIKLNHKCEKCGKDIFLGEQGVYQDRFLHAKCEIKQIGLIPYDELTEEQRKHEEKINSVFEGL